MEKHKGLTKKEAQKRLKNYGFNELEDLNKTSTLKILLRQIKSNFVIYFLFFGALLSFFVGKDITGYTIIAVIIIVISMGFFQEYKADRAIKALKNMLMPVSVVIRDGKEIEIPSKELVPGDIILIRSGEKIPADCLILDEKELRIDESVLTGESAEVKKSAAKSEKKYSKENLIFMGTHAVNGKCTAKILHTGMNTEFGKIAGMISTAEKELPLQKKVNIIVRFIVFVGITISIITGLIMLVRGMPITYDIVADVLIVVIALCVASFPEGFPVVLISALASGAYRMAKKNAIVNRMSIIETLGETTVICSDKTGTITRGEMTARLIYAEGKEFEITGVGYDSHGEIKHNKKTIDAKKSPIISSILKASVLCNDAKIEIDNTGKEYHVRGSPTEASLLIASAKAGIFIEDTDSERIEEIPFSSERKMMTVLSKEKGKKYVYSKGAPEILIEKCSYIQKGGRIVSLTKKEKDKILRKNKDLTLKRYRVLSIAYKTAKAGSKQITEKDLVFLGLIALEDPPRPEVKSALKQCKEAGIKVKMITGDNKDTAVEIAQEIGLKGKVITGDEIDKLTDDELYRTVKGITVFARVRPEHKIRIVAALKKHGEIVTMTGDGVNDAPALKEAHIGVAMGKCGTDVSREVSDLTLKDDNFATIVDAVKEGRTIFSNIQKFSGYQISVNISQLCIIFFAILIGMPLPLVAIQILFMNLFSDEITAITLAFNPYSKDVMSAKPRKNSAIITKQLFFLLLVAGLIMSIGSLIAFNNALSAGKPVEQARTVAFVAMVLFGIANAYNFRSFRKPTLTRSPFSNIYLIYASIFAVAVTLLIIYTPAKRIFETVPIPAEAWILPAILSFSIIVIFDIIKAIDAKTGFLAKNL